ncbi:hypothetical protein AAVH_20608 [Aphelenchoides avenae]|nr:hypothetical protein AAVH_20608 [Aphelenchus avenae]
MVPLETFADIAFFLGYYDLVGLKLANQMLKALADKCADAIRLFDFSDTAFFLRDSRIIVYRLTSTGCFGPLICQLELGSEDELAVFVSEAFRNCTVGRFAWIGHSQRVLQATRDVAKTIAVDSLVVMVDHFEDFRELEGYVDDFRRVKDLEVSQSHRLAPDEKTNLQRFCQRKNVSKLFCLP